jgi:hypothetical protein
MRLHRENTLIENNLYPLAVYNPADIQKKFVEILRPLETDILQVEAALLLHNVPLLAVLAIFFLGIEALALLLTPCLISYLTLVFITVPAFTLVYTLGGVSFGRSLYLKELPVLSADNPRRLRTLEEIVAIIWFPLLWGWRAAFFFYRLFVAPNAIDTIGFVVVAVILGWIFKILNLLKLLVLATVIGLVTPALFTLTPAKAWLEKLVDAIKTQLRKKKGDV